MAKSFTSDQLWAGAYSGNRNDIPTAVQGDGSVSFPEGYGDDYSKTEGTTGKKNVPRLLENQFKFLVTEAVGELQAKGFHDWDLNFAPYAINSTVRHNNVNYFSNIGNNSNEPGTDSTWTVLGADSASPGQVIMWGGSTPATGYLEMDGSAISRTTYADLFAAIGTTFGAGDGSTTFNLPDARGEFIRGWDNGRGIDSGRALGSFQDHAIPDISGTFKGYTAASAAATTGPFSSDAATLGGPQTVDNSGEGQNTVTFDPSTVTNVADETRPRNIALMFCIKY